MKVAVIVCVLALAVISTASAKTCAEQREHILQEIKDNPNMTLYPPTCDSDGSYSAKQCIKSTCICVNKDGNSLNPDNKIYGSHIRNSRYMICKCAREEDALKHVVGKRVVCTDNGNYAHLQCLGTKCFCVEEMEGTQISDSVDRWESDKLNC